MNANSEKPAGIFDPRRLGNGFVAFFDILGYKNLVKNNDIGLSVRVLDAALHRIPEFIKKGWWGESNPPRKIVFADSIVFYAPIPEVDDLPSSNGCGILPFLAHCQSLMSALYHTGLPARGAIAKGEFYVHGHIFSGKPLIEAHECAEALNMSGCAIAESAEAVVSKTQEPIPDMDWVRGPGQCIIRYDTPLKNGLDRNLALLAFRSGSLSNQPISYDEVLNKFEAHNKGVDDSVVIKAKNTWKFLDECRQQEQARTTAMNAFLCSD